MLLVSTDFSSSKQFEFPKCKNINLNVVQWNLDLTKGQGTGKICSLQRHFVISRFFFIHFTITAVKKIVRYTEDFFT